MQTASYSKRSLVEKLGIKPDFHIALIHSPAGYQDYLDDLPDGVKVTHQLGESLDLVQYFVTERSTLEKEFPKLTKTIKSNGTIWISWPKGSAKVETDLNENAIREIGLANGVVDVKVIAIDDVWSGLKFVFRLKDRGP